MINKNKTYIGSYPSEELAGTIYDILSIKTREIKARTNFVYNSHKLKNIIYFFSVFVISKIMSLK